MSVCCGVGWLWLTSFGCGELVESCGAFDWVVFPIDWCRSGSIDSPCRRWAVLFRSWLSTACFVTSGCFAPKSNAHYHRFGRQTAQEEAHRGPILKSPSSPTLLTLPSFPPPAGWAECFCLLFRLRSLRCGRCQVVTVGYWPAGGARRRGQRRRMLSWSQRSTPQNDWLRSRPPRCVNVVLVQVGVVFVYFGVRVWSLVFYK